MRFQQSLDATEENSDSTCNLWRMRQKKEERFQFGIKAFNGFGESHLTTTYFHSCVYNSKSKGMFYY